MCGRYAIFTPTKQLAERFDAKLPENRFGSSYNVAPSQDVPIITEEESHQMVMAHWGYPMHIAGKSKELINMRAESFTEKPWFQRLLKGHKCLVLADGFYEWRKSASQKMPYWIALKDRAPFAFAGVYAEPNNADEPHFAIITTNANNIVSKVHDRMPVMLKEGEDRKWLESDAEPKMLVDYLDPYPASKMVAYPVSMAVNKPANNSEKLLERVYPKGKEGLFI